ncbi:zeta toxin family protein [Flavobacterium sp.]|uniref:zeta toxin family protein n=1 Tax=Flavobacterium sp. TaxID=239 RepID=UPI000EE96993|nr:zeta toxin family protein [Flavobacterium sp.]HCQ13872.1 hypothetical protein [Flavobacterium sp.]
MQSSKRIRLFAGPNGSGKSTLFQEFSKDFKQNTGFFVNADKLEKELSQSGFIDLKQIGISVNQSDLDEFKLAPSSISLFDKATKENHPINVYIKEDCIVDSSKDTHSYEGSFIAAFIRHLLIKNNKSFSFESVMSHPSKINEIKEAIQHGYKPYLYFVCIDSPTVNKSRVIDRVKKGGHAVSEDKIEERYYRTLELLHKILPICYRAYLFDNSGKNLQLIAELYKESLVLMTETPPKWFVNYVLPHYK